MTSQDNPRDRSHDRSLGVPGPDAPSAGAGEAATRVSQGPSATSTASSVRAPVDPRLLRRAGATRTYLVAGVAVGCATALLTVAQAWLLSHSIADVVATHAVTTLAWAVPGVAAVFGAKALLAWLNQWLAHRAAAAVKSQLRRDVLAARLARPIDPAISSAGLITLVTQGVDALDGYFAKYLPQLVLAVTVPLIVGVAILTADLTSALIVAVTVPLIPVFMALVGWTTEARTKRRWRMQTRLANHFADLIAGLPTLQVFGRARAQAEGLLRTEAAHRRETMATLRISFLSALVLELLATLSVALVAVSIGFRVVFYGIDLTTALYVLILAPEVYLPVRQVGVHYHDSADGLAAAQAAFAIIDGGEATDGPAGTGTRAAPAGETPRTPGQPEVLDLCGVSHTYPGAAVPAVQGVDLRVSSGQLVVLAGPSGGGKTTILHAILGFLTPTAGTVRTCEGPLTPANASRWRRRLAYVPQSPGLINGTVADNVRLGAPTISDGLVREVLDRAGAPDIALAHSVGDDGEGLSAGERRRVALARALARIGYGGASVLVLDEPTAGLDAATEARVLDELRSLGTTAIVVSHRPAVIAAADQVLTVGDGDPQA